jgi:hypothetical protein
MSGWGQKRSPIGIHGEPAWCIAAMALVAEMEKERGDTAGETGTHSDGSKKFPYACNQPLPVA